MYLVSNQIACILTHLFSSFLSMKPIYGGSGRRYQKKAVTKYLKCMPCLIKINVHACPVLVTVFKDVNKKSISIL